jgi:hypothetical protein
MEKRTGHIHYEARKSLVIRDRLPTSTGVATATVGGSYVHPPPSSSPVAVFGMSCAVRGALLAGPEPMPAFATKSCLRLSFADA